MFFQDFFVFLLKDFYFKTLMTTIEISDKLYKDIEIFCVLNSYDVNLKIIEFIMQGFNIAKYGLSPFSKPPKDFQKDEIKKDELELTQNQEIVKIEDEPSTNELNQSKKRTRKVKIIKK